MVRYCAGRGTEVKGEAFEELPGKDTLRLLAER